MSALQQEIKAAVKEALAELLPTQALGKRLLSPKEAANYLKHSPQTLREMVAREELRAVKTESGRRVMFDIHDLDEWIERHKT